MDNIEAVAHIRAAYAAVKEVNIQGETLRLAAFSYALANITQLEPNLKPDTMLSSGDNSAYDKISVALDVPLEVVELFFDVHGDSLSLNLSSKVLARSASAAMREIAIVLTVGIKYAGIAESTTFNLIRSACEGHGRLDKKNFAAIMGSMRPSLTVAGKGSERALIAKKPADDLAREILVRYSQII